MLLRNISVYLLCFSLVYIPQRPAKAALPVALAYAFNFAAPRIVQYAASNLTISTIARGFGANDPYYASKGKLSNGKYLSFLKGKGKFIGYLAAGLTSLGFIVHDSGIFKSSSEPVKGDVSPQKGVFWDYRGTVASSPSEAVDLFVGSHDNLLIYYHSFDFVQSPPPNAHTLKVYAYLKGGSRSGHSGFSVVKSACHSRSSHVETCQPDYQFPSSSLPASLQDLSALIFPWLKNQPQDKQHLSVANEDGALHPDIAKALEMPPKPVMPDGSPLPAQGDNAWVYASHHLSGYAQSTSPSNNYYIPPAQWDNSVYLANDVAGGNQAIVDSNQVGSTEPVPEPEPEPNPDPQPEPEPEPEPNPTPEPNPNAPVDLTGIESRIDKTNALLTALSSSSVETNMTPNKSVAESFWDSNYPNGFITVFDEFQNKFNNTGLVTWLDSFKLNFTNAGYPTWQLCFDLGVVDLGCHSLEIDSRVWVALRIFIIFTAVLLSRRLVFGG